MFGRRRGAVLQAPPVRAAHAAREAGLARVLAVVDEAVVRQDEAEAVLLAVRDRAPLRDAARRGGRLASRFLTLRAELPEPGGDELLRAYVEAVDEVLLHHAMLLSSSLDTLAVDWRSDRMVDLLERIDGLGPPAERLDGLWSELRALSSPRS
jgi:hypothetical protein